MKKLFIILFTLGVIQMINANTDYKTPPNIIAELYNRERNPYINFVPYEDFGIEVKYQLHQSLEQLSEPNVKLAGKSITKRLNARIDSYPTQEINIFQINNRNRTRITLPKNAKIRKRNLSINNQKLALLNETEDGVQLIIADIKTGKSKIFEDFCVNDILDDGIVGWMNDNKHIILEVIPENRGPEPIKPRVPNSPSIEETSGKKSTLRTYQNLLQNKYDEKLFQYYFTSQLIKLNIESGEYDEIGTPQIYYDINISPDNQYLLVEMIQKPYSYQVPYYYFPRKFEIWDSSGSKVKTLHARGLQDEIPIGGTYIGPRYYRWQPLKDATLVWIEAQDKGDPKVKIDFRDKIFRISAPFTNEPEEIFKTEHRFSGIDWSEKMDELIYYEYDRDKLWKKGWLLKIGSQPKLILDLSVRDEYNDPGHLVTKKTRRGKSVFVKDDEIVFFQNNTGATPDGNYPYLAKYNLKTNKKQIIFRCDEGFHETVQNFTGDNLDKIIIRSENKKTPPNYFVYDLNNKKREQITKYQNNFKELTGLQKQIVTYTRDDSIPLSGDLYLPEDYDGSKRLPLVINAYPEEYVDSSTAGQINKTPNKFIRFWGASIRYFTLQGYAVLTKASIPIVGDPQTVNETFIKQTVSSVEAAIDFLDKKEIIDPNRVGITGHSYGAFMVANVLANSDICAAGIARSGAYNRTLTPFGFQSERRIFWKAKDFYLKVSPFAHAEKIKEPLLLIHGANDPNSGTYPLQSKRFYQALKGTGGTAKLVILPYEGHSYRAAKSGLHVLAEMIEWFDRFVKKKN